MNLLKTVKKVMSIVFYLSGQVIIFVYIYCNLEVVIMRIIKCQLWVVVLLVSNIFTILLVMTIKHSAGKLDI